MVKNLRERILNDIKSAMREKDRVRLETLRFLNSSIKNKEIDLRPKVLTEQDTLSVLKKMVKQRKESIAQYTSAGRQDLAEKETQELKILEDYMPEPMSREAVKKLVLQAIDETGATNIKDMGKVIKYVLTKVEGAADGQLVSELVKSQLA